MVEMTDEEKKELEKKQTSLDEVPLYWRICNVNAIVLMSVALFVWGFFA